MKQPIQILVLAATAAAFSTGCLSVTGFDAPCPARSVEDSLSVAVVTQAAKGGEALAAGVKSAACKNISGKGFRLVDGNQPADVAVGFGVSQTEYNRAGDFIVYDGAVNARISVPSDDNRIIDEKTFSARGERALGEAAATGRLCEAIIPQIESWVNEAVTAKKLAVDAVSVAVEYRHVKASKKVVLVDDFIKAAKGTPGVRDCQLIGETWLPGGWGATYTATYRIIYDAVALPNGPLNTIAIKNPGLKLSVLPAPVIAR